jgi:hypothetical protein
MYRLLLALVRSFSRTSADVSAGGEIAPTQGGRTASEARRCGCETGWSERAGGAGPQAVAGIPQAVAGMVMVPGAVPVDQPGVLVYAKSRSELLAAQVPPAPSHSERLSYYATAPPLRQPCKRLLRFSRRHRPALRSDGRKPSHRASLEQRCGRAFGPVQPHYRSDRMPVLGRLSVAAQAGRSLTGPQEVIQCSTS